MPVQSAQVIGYATETTYGTFVAPTNGGITVDQKPKGYIPGIATPNTSTKVARPEQSRGTRDYYVDALVGEEAGITIATELIPEVVSGLCAAWCGTGSDAKSGSSTTGFTHTLTPQNVCPALSVELDSDITTETLVRQFCGCVVDQVVIRSVSQALATIEFQLLAQRETNPGTIGKPNNATPEINTLQPVDFALLECKFRGTSFIGSTSVGGLQDATITCMNHVQRVFASNKQIYITRLVPTRREVTFQTTFDFLNAELYEAWIKGEQYESGGFQFIWTTAYQITNSTGGGHPNVIELSIPKLRPQGQYNLASASDVLNQQISWSALAKPAGTATPASEPALASVNFKFINSESKLLA